MVPGEAMIVPLNLSPRAVRRLRSTESIPKARYYVEDITHVGCEPSITFVSKRTPKQNRTDRVSCQIDLATEEFELVLRSIRMASQQGRQLTMETALDDSRLELVRAVSLTILRDDDKDSFPFAIELWSRAYFGGSLQGKSQLRTAILEWLPHCSYRSLLDLLAVCEKLLAGHLSGEEWRFLEHVVAYCIYIKSPEISMHLTRILDLVSISRNIVLYVSTDDDAHFTEHMQVMPRQFFFVQLDPYLSLYSSPQGYPIPLENVFLLFQSAHYVWWRKPSGFPRGKTALDKFTKREIEHFVDQLRQKYSHKLFPQVTLDDMKLLYFDVIASLLSRVRICESGFENSTYLWRHGDFVKPLRTQVVFNASADVEQSFSPFVYEGTASAVISIMPPIIRQPNLPKVYEVRGTFFLDEISCVRIDTPRLGGERGGIDWRFSSGVFENMRPIDLPDEIAQELIECFVSMDLRFCTFDLVFDGHDFYLLDINHNGQWIFSDELCGMKVTRKILDYLGQADMPS